MSGSRQRSRITVCRALGSALGDTSPSEDLVAACKGVDVPIHEAIDREGGGEGGASQPLLGGRGERHTAPGEGGASSAECCRALPCSPTVPAQPPSSSRQRRIIREGGRGGGRGGGATSGGGEGLNGPPRQHLPSRSENVAQLAFSMGSVCVCVWVCEQCRHISVCPVCVWSMWVCICVTEYSECLHAPD